MPSVFWVFSMGVWVKYEFLIVNNSLFITFFLTEGHYLLSLGTLRLSKNAYMKSRQILISGVRPNEK